MQGITLDAVYAMSDIFGGNGIPIDGDGLEAVVGWTFSVANRANALALALVQTGHLSLARGITVKNGDIAAGSQVDVRSVWWDETRRPVTLLDINGVFFLAADAPLETGRAYTVSNHIVDRPAAPPDVLMAGTWVRCPDGLREVSTLRPGDPVWSADCGTLPLKAVFKRTYPAWATSAPVVIKAGTLAATHDLALSPSQCVEISGAPLNVLKSETGALAYIGSLENGDTVRRVDLGFVTYIGLHVGGPARIEANGVIVQLVGKPFSLCNKNHAAGAPMTLINPLDSGIVGAML